jgi:hypothetical protein
VLGALNFKLQQNQLVAIQDHGNNGLLRKRAATHVLNVLRADGCYLPGALSAEMPAKYFLTHKWSSISATLLFC